MKFISYCILASLAFYTNAHSETFKSFKPASVQPNLKFSTLIWKDSSYSKVLESKPSEADDIQLTGGPGLNTEIDTDLYFRSFSTDNCIFAKDRNFNLGSFQLGIPNHPIVPLTAILENCTIKVSKIFEVATHSNQNTSNASYVDLTLKNSTFTCSGDFVLDIRIPDILADQQSITGLKFRLEGNSNVKFAGNISVDEMTISNPRQVQCIFEFIEVDSKIPTITFDGDKNNIASSRLNFVFGEDIKDGEYTLFKFNSYCLEGVFSKIYVNNIKIPFNTKIRTNKKFVTLLKTKSGIVAKVEK